nr:hypothetical protein CFP56_00397 [Quercus suber]
MTTTLQYTRHQSATPALLTRHRSRPTYQPIQIDVQRVKSNDTAIMSRELPIPKINQIYSLNQAHATLLHCWNKLSAIARGASPSSSLTLSPASSVDSRLECHQWLERWEQAFKTFLSSSMSTMAPEDLSQCRVLKANHLACTILAGSTTSAANEFETEFQAITELAGAVLSSRHATDSPRSTKPQGGDRVSSGLDPRVHNGIPVIREESSSGLADVISGLIFSRLTSMHHTAETESITPRDIWKILLCCIANACFMLGVVESLLLAIVLLDFGMIPSRSVAAKHETDHSFAAVGSLLYMT